MRRRHGYHDARLLDWHLAKAMEDGNVADVAEAGPYVVAHLAHFLSKQRRPSVASTQNEFQVFFPTLIAIDS